MSAHGWISDGDAYGPGSGCGRFKRGLRWLTALAAGRVSSRLWRQLAPELCHVARERGPVTVRLERLPAGLEQLRDALQVIEEGNLAGRIVPFAGVVAAAQAASAASASTCISSSHQPERTINR